MIELPDQNSAFSILIVDDTLENLQLLAKMLTGQGYLIRKTTSGKLAIQFAQLQPPDLILMDVSMPEMDGYQVCRQLKDHATTRDIPVIFISALDRLGNKVQGFEVGGVDYITKPFQEEEVLMRVKTQLILQFQKQQLIAQNQRLEEEIQQRQLAEQSLKEQIERERLLGRVIRQVRQSLNLDEVLSTTVTEARQLLQTDRALVYRANPDTAGTIVSEADAPNVDNLQQRSLPQDIFPQEHHTLYLQGRIRSVMDIEQDTLAACLVETLRQLGVKAKLVAPIVTHSEISESLGDRPAHPTREETGDQLWGLLVFHQCGETRQWQPSEVELLKQLADQVAIAIQQSELYQQIQALNTTLEDQVRQRTSELQQSLEFEALLKRITDKVRDSLDENQILQTAVEELCSALHLDCCDVGLYNAELTASTIAYECTTSFPPALGSTFIFAEDALPDIRHHLLQGKPFLHRHIDTERVEQIHQSYSLLACPIYDNEGILGDIWLFRPVEGQFDEREVRLVQQVANQCAIALRQSRLYQAAQAQVEELERLSRLKDDFLSTVSHELRSPMSSIKMATHMLKMSLEPLGVLDDETAPISRYFKILQDEGEREINLINDLLDMTRLDADTEPFYPSPLVLHYFIPHVLESFGDRIAQQQQHLTVAIPDDLPTLMTDPGYLGRILTELLHNACKYTPSGENIAVSAQAKNQGIEIKVSNFGIEIPPTERDRIFDKFYRIPNHDPWKQGGTGLGLALVKKLTEFLGATICLESGEGQTAFILHFPHLPAS